MEMFPTLDVLEKAGLAVASVQRVATAHLKSYTTSLAFILELQQKMREVSLAHLSLSVKTKFPSLSLRAIKVLTPFTSTYLKWIFCLDPDYRQVPVKGASGGQPANVPVISKVHHLCAAKMQTHCSR